MITTVLSISGFLLALLAFALLLKEKSKAAGTINGLMLEQGKNESTLLVLREALEKLEREYLELKLEHGRTEKLFYDAQKHLELKTQSMQEFEKRVSDWESSKQEALTQTKAAIFETAYKLSDQLLERHKAETKEAEEKISETTKNLQNQFQSILQQVAVLNSEIKSSKDTIDCVKSALLSPAGAGNLAEITLENILKASGLEPERDFFMQYSFNVKGSVDVERLRPDAIVFLPHNNLLIIDSKASKYFMELLSIEQSDSQRKALEAQLKNTMNSHLKNFHSKDYKEFLLQHFKDRELNHVSSVMFLPTESSIEKLSIICKDFMQRAWEKDIFPMGPTGLINALGYAKFQIAAVRQSENQKIIMEEVRKLLLSLMTLYEHAKKVGQNIYAACGNFDKLAASFNSNLLPKARNLEKLGVAPKSKSVPGALDRLTVISTAKAELIQAETEDFA
jgi:DNA recombination protein RmuC